ncbi:[protein-PII] uridylyltransferase family protein [Thermovibrio sp.]
MKLRLTKEWEEGVSFVNSSDLPNKRRALIYLEKLANSLKERPKWLDREYLNHLLRLFSYSAYLAEFLVKEKGALLKLKGIYREKFKPSDFKLELKEKKKEELLFFKNLQMARVVLRDILGLAPFKELVRDATLIHKALFKGALGLLQREFKDKYGEPSCGFVIIDMGKAAGFELNYSSDIDVMFVYKSRFGKSSGGKLGELQNHDYFTLLSRELLKLLEGVVKVDTRLRPNGTMGPLVNDILALEEYYTAVARPWERFALLKARPSVGDLKETGLEFLKLAKAFVYRKYIDLTLIEEVLRLKELIKNKVLKKRGKIDLKLGRGGIREIEFIVQAFQLIYGGKDRKIRSMNTLTALEKLFKWGYLKEKEFKELKEDYLFLRKAEHMLQITYFRQTQTFHPESEEAEELALKMGFKEREDFLKELKRRMERINSYFTKFFHTGDRKPLSTFTAKDLEEKGFSEPEEVKRFLEVLLSMKGLTSEEVNRIDVMGDRFLRFLLEAPNSKNTMKNLILFLESEEGKLFFFSVLNQINALNLLFYLLSTKEFFIKRFKENPELINYIFSPNLIEEGVCEKTFKELYKELKNLKLTKNILEVVALLRYRLKRNSITEFFKEITVNWDLVIDEVYSKLKPSFSLASLGKHGSYEMNIGSDLDLLFIKGDKEEKDTALNFIRELEGLGCEVDTRLRPFGEKGELLFSLSYLKNYFKSSARLWERLAFTRFRFLKGNLKEELEKAVKEFLFGSPLNLKELDEIEKMRERLERELSKGKEDIKYGKGGVVDLEFASYTYQLIKGVWIRNTYKTLLQIEKEGFKGAPDLYVKLREAETEKRLFGDFIKYKGKIGALKEEVRKFYKEFMQWSRKRLSEDTL